MRRRVPLNAVRAFEAAARYRSLVRAADELCVTPTAISHQLRQLEDFLQVKLFTRHHGRLDLTPASRRCFMRLTEAFDQIEVAMADVVRPEGGRERLVIGASASVSTLFLLPRLHRFVTAEPHVDVVMQTFVQRAAIEADNADLWISTWKPNLDRRIEPLMQEDVVPMCAPTLLGEGDPADLLAEAPLIHDDKKPQADGGQFPTWARYLAEFGIERPDVANGLRFNQSSVAVEAAVGGYGILLGRSLLVAPLLESGRLVRIAEPYPIRQQYYLVSPPQAKTNLASAAFRDWLLHEADDLMRSSSRPGADERPDAAGTEAALEDSRALMPADRGGRAALPPARPRSARGDLLPAARRAADR